MTKVSVSVLVPVYNAEGFIENTISKLLSQTFKDFEVVCVDDGSRDRSAEIIEKIRKKNGIVKLIKQENEGVGGALKKAALNASGRYVLPIGHDDWLSDDAIEKAYNTAIQSQSNTVIFDLFSVSEKDGEQRAIDMGRIKWPLDGMTAMLYTLGSWKIHGFALYEKSMYLNCYNDFNTNIYSADEIATRILLYRSNRVNRTDGRYYYYNTPNSLTKSFTTKRFEFLDAQIEILDFLVRENIMKEAGKGWAIDTLKWARSLHQFLKEFKGKISADEYKSLEIKLKQTISMIPNKYLFEIVVDGSVSSRRRVQALLALIINQI